MFITRLQHVVLRRYTFPKPTRSPHILVTKPKISRAPVRTMAWRSHAESNEGLVNNLVRFQVVAAPEVVSAMKATDRGLYVRHPEVAYVDSPSPIGWMQTISAPHMHGTALELLKDHLKPGNIALDVGSGSGYLSAVMSRMVAPMIGDAEGHDGLVIGIDVIPELVEQSKRNVELDHGAKSRVDKGVLKLIVGDGWKGAPEYGPYDAIHVGAAAAKVPESLIEQLKPGGRMVIPVGPEGEVQSLAVIDKSEDGKATRRDLMDVQYVPLVQDSAR